MEGLTILNSIISYPEWIAPIVILLIVFFTCIILYIIFSNRVKSTPFKLIPVLIMTIGFVTAFVSFSLNNFKYYKYEAIISDELKASEFNGKYRIVSKRGEIYTIEERIRQYDSN